jgi:UDP-4-amino-4,6-dideoxy-N-acetyl-beta-L-altrosamine transaminase
MIPYGRQCIDEDDIAAVTDVLRSPWLTQGPAVPAFEKALAAKVGAEEVVAVSNGTAALHLACLALGLGKGDYLWTTPLSFVASANCGLYCQAQVEFVDIDPVTRNMCPEKLANQLAQAKKANVLPKILVVVHFAGLPCDLKPIRELTDHYGIYLIEDAAHAIGSTYEGQAVGNGSYSDATVFSFHPVKTLAAGEGGALVTNDTQLANNVRKLASHGIERNSELWQREVMAPCYYEQQVLGFNYRLSDIHAALALSQLNKLDAFVEARREKAALYLKGLLDSPLQLPVEPSNCYSAWHIYVVTFESMTQRNHCYQVLRDRDIYTNVHYMPIHQQPHYRPLARYFGSHFPAAEHHYNCSLTLPLFTTLSDAQQVSVISGVKESL